MRWGILPSRFNVSAEHATARAKRSAGGGTLNPHGPFKARKKCVERNLSAIVIVEPSLNTPLRVFVPELSSVWWVLPLLSY
jgi:hypothetical protein